MSGFRREISRWAVPGESESLDDEKPAHQVTITTGFWMGQSPVTQEAYQRVMGQNPSHFKGAQLPVENVSWDEAQIYCQAVGMRLPTEAEWEYAARAGTTGSRYGDIDQVAWYRTNSGGKTHEVARKLPNAWALYDMMGNVWEWTSNWYSDKYTGNSETDPRGPASGLYRVLRGGSWLNDPRYIRASHRNWVVPVGRNLSTGLRCVGY
jgi:formylglycine-generating enzyme required for sulfatase activity